jgi:hypothetical protein
MPAHDVNKLLSSGKPAYISSYSMNFFPIAKIISIFSYCLIMLQGDMISMPFGIWLLLSFFDFSSLAPLFSTLAISGGLLACLTKPDHRWYITRILVAFILLLSPILWRLSVVPLRLFDYLSFEIPLFLFIAFFFLSFVLAFGKRAVVENN